MEGVGLFMTLNVWSEHLSSQNRPAWISSRHNHLHTINCLHGPHAQPHHPGVHTSMMEEVTALSGQPPCLCLGVTALGFYEVSAVL